MATSSEVIGSGTAAGVMEFCDYLMERGILSKSAVNPWKSASRTVFARVEGTEDFGDVNVRGLEIEEYMGRFINKTQGEYKPESLAAYSSRFRKALENYRAYLADPAGWRPQVRSGTARAVPATKAEKKPSGPPGRRANPATEAPAAPPEVEGRSTPKLVTYPFPMASGEMAYVQLPQRVAKADADRLAQFLQSLVVERPTEPPSSSSDGE